MRNTSPQYDCTVVGGGIVGLALALALLQRHPGCRLLLLEKETGLARHQTGHNSGVIHSGVYYKPGSLKARLCVEGGREMLQFCAEHGIAHQSRGKVIVATHASELPGLEELHRRGQANGVAGLRLLGPAQLREIEPSVTGGIRALHVPGVSIVDYSQVAARYAERIQAAGGEIVRQAEVAGVRTFPAEIVLETGRGSFRTRWAANCAGLHADRLYRLAGGRGVRAAIIPFRGEYYELAAPAAQRVQGLIYPVPDPRFPFLGVHFTPRIQGGVEAGPNAVLAFKREGYAKSSLSLRDVGGMLSYPGFWMMAARYGRYGLKEQFRSLNRGAFLRALKVMMPDLIESDIQPGGAGVRAQLVLRNGKLMDDFRIEREGNFVHVLNVPSPAATASLAIARHLVQQMADCGFST